MDDGTAFNGHARTEDDIRLDQYVLADLGIEGQENGFGRYHGYA